MKIRQVKETDLEQVFKLSNGIRRVLQKSKAMDVPPS